MATFHIGIRETREDEINVLWTIERPNHEQAIELAKSLLADSGPYWRAYLNGCRITPIARTGRKGDRPIGEGQAFRAGFKLGKTAAVFRSVMGIELFPDEKEA